MSRLFGEIRQLGYVVRDIEAAMRHWIETIDVGPWFYVDRLPAADFQYRGAPSEAHISIAISNSGPLQVELIQQRNQAPSMYLDFLAAGNEGLQHFCYWPEDYDSVLTRALAAGFTIGQSGTSAGRGPFVYLEPEGHPGSVVELAEYSQTRRRQFAAIEAAARDWDGSDPIRTDWPT